MAAIACAWFRKNVFQLCEGDPSCTMYLETVDWATSTSRRVQPTSLR
jgi:hypothetical protein